MLPQGSCAALELGSARFTVGGSGCGEILAAFLELQFLGVDAGEGEEFGSGPWILA